MQTSVSKNAIWPRLMIGPATSAAKAQSLPKQAPHTQPSVEVAEHVRVAAVLKGAELIMTLSLGWYLTIRLTLEFH